MKIIKTENGWEIWDGYAFEPDSVVYGSKAEARAALDKARAEFDAWNRQTCDAPHLDNF